MNIMINSNILRALFQNIYFLNGTAYAGKSTMVKLLAEKHNGICCGENYHLELLHLADPVHQPNLCYMQTMGSWQEFVSRTPDEYDAWLQNTAKEAAQLELVKLIELAATGKMIFVDTNIPVEMLQEISDYNRVAIMLAPPELSVSRFFDRPDAEKQFLFQQLLLCPDPDAAIENYRNCLAMINSQERYEGFAESGFFTHVRTQDSTIENTLSILERHFNLI